MINILSPDLTIMADEVDEVAGDMAYMSLSDFAERKVMTHFLCVVSFLHTLRKRQVMINFQIAGMGVSQMLFPDV